MGVVVFDHCITAVFQYHSGIVSMSKFLLNLLFLADAVDVYS